MSYKRICTCGQLVPSGATCACQKFMIKHRDKKHPCSTRRFQKLRKQIILRDNGYCQRCLHKFHEIVMEQLECHHIKSWRDYPELAYDENNLIMVCRRCNLDLGTKNKLDFEWEVPDGVSYFL